MRPHLSGARSRVRPSWADESGSMGFRSRGKADPDRDTLEDALQVGKKGRETLNGSEGYMLWNN